MISVATATTALTIGLLGGVHCVAMCGGIAAALTLAEPAGQRHTAAWARQLCYGLGRVTSYAVAGAFVGAAGVVLADLLGSGGAFALRVAAAALLVMIGLQIGGWWSGATALERAGAKVWNRLTPSLPARSGTVSSAIAVGVAWGWLPCGLVYSTLAWAASSADPIEASMRMIFFGLGTLPAVALSGAAATRFAALTRRTGARRAAGAVVVILALWTAFSARTLLGSDGADCGHGPQHGPAATHP